MFEDINTTRQQTYERGPAHARGWGLVVAIGVILMVLGAFAMGSGFVAGLASMMFLGTLLMVGGIAEILGAFRLRVRGFAAPFLAGLLSAIVGALLVWQPIAGLAATGALIGAYLVTSGLFRGITSLVDRYDQWGWDLLYGVVAVLLGVSVLATWPLSSLWLVGTLVAVELVFRGVAWIGAGLALRKLGNTVRDVITRTG